MNLTAEQKEAVAARGNVLVVAGAGTGKTRTLVERCLDCLVNEKPRVSLEEILLVTFTEAAAAEMRQRVRARMEDELARNPGDAHWQEQLGLFETAHLGTIHRFCFELVRAHFYELGLDPQLSILPEEETRLLAEETLEELLQGHYARKGKDAEAVQQLIHAQAKGSDQPIRALVLRIHMYAQSLPSPSEWLREQSATFANPQPSLWQAWLQNALADWRGHAIAFLNQLGAGNLIAEQCLHLLEQLPQAADDLLAPAQPTAPRQECLPGSRTEFAAALSCVLAAAENCPRGKKKHWVKPLKDFLDECRFLQALAQSGPEGDPLKQDWDWVRGQMAALLDLVREFGAAFTETKREMGALDFQDLEQYALRLLWDHGTAQPTQVAREWRQRLRFVFVDEYQDVNAAQDKIIQALSRDDLLANRFLVGDVKQSIYRFRLANPHIFQNYLQQWRNGCGRAIPLRENFRSRKGILEFINSVFEQLMHRELGGIEYDEQAELRFGGAEMTDSNALADGIPVEIRFRLKGQLADDQPETPEDEPETADELSELEEAAKEARAIAQRLLSLRAARHPVWDEGERRFRPVEWRDIAILLRAPSNKAESYAKEFARLNVPLELARGGFYDGLEIGDLLSLLQVLDNPLQDLPLLAVLRSPLVGLSLDELAQIRLASRKSSFWTALVRWHQMHSMPGREPVCQANSQPETPGDDRMPAAPSAADFLSPAGTAALHDKVSVFLEQIARWRRLARQVALSRCLEVILAETLYPEWLASQTRGEQRCANVRRLLQLAQRFDQLQRQGLFRFLRFIEAQRRANTEPELTAVSAENSVRLLSIHQSKGLEFPVVVLADLGKTFNVADLRSEIILDEQFGLCPQVKPPHTGARYPSLPHWLAARRQHRELLGEELRLLYVGMTRARDLLILSGSISRNCLDKIWPGKGKERAPFPPLHKARSCADWLGAWFGRNIPANSEWQGEHDLARWTIQDDGDLAPAGAIALPEPTAEGANANAESVDWQELERRFEFVYPFSTSLRLPAKTSVSALRGRALNDEGDSASPVLVLGRKTGAVRPLEQSAAVQVGNAHHAFLQLLALDRISNEGQLRAEADRLVRERGFRQEQVALLDFKAIAAFWNSELGRRVRENAASVQRELAFTFRLPAAELASLIGAAPEAVSPHDFVVVQGIADLAVLLPGEIWVVDFKTDRVISGEEPAARHYEQQLQLYARGLSQIYRRPVTEAWLHYLSAHQSVPVQLFR